MTPTATRPETAARWERAAERAVAEGITARAVGDGRYATCSGSVAGVSYVTTADTCTCRAGSDGDPVCKHRAAVRALIAAETPEPPTPAASGRCGTCGGAGRVVKASAWFAGRTVEGFCPDCTPHVDWRTRRVMLPAAA